MKQKDIKPKVSICCLTYNHEKYLKKALDGILMQKTDFPYEIIIGEDCSTDNSRKVIDEYVSAYPELFTVLYREKNVGTRKNMDEVFALAKGAYFCILETDDYWIDPEKLQIQVDWLDNHPDCLAVTHQCQMVDQFDNNLDISYPQIRSGYYQWKDYRNDCMPGQTASVLARNYYAQDLFDISLIDETSKDYGPGDRRRFFMLRAHGQIYCLDRVMSCYRFVTTGGDSYTAKNKFDYELQIKYYREFVKYAQRAGLRKDALLTAESLYARALWIAFLHRQKEVITFAGLCKAYKDIQYKFGSTVNVFRFYALRFFRGKEYYYKKRKKESGAA